MGPIALRATQGASLLYLWRYPRGEYFSGVEVRLRLIEWHGGVRFGEWGVMNSKKHLSPRVPPHLSY